MGEKEVAAQAVNRHVRAMLETTREHTTGEQGNGRLHLILWGLLGVMLVVMIRAAWMSDDAYISFRTIDNFVHGYGLRWNVDERVQSFTNPLWVLLLSLPYLITQEIYFTGIVVSLLFSLAAIVLVARKVAVSGWMGVFAAIALLSSKAFIDYTTSGLEQPLLFFLAALFFWRFLKYDDTPRSFGWLALIAALSMTTRMDTALLFAPTLLLLFWRQRSLRIVLYGLAGLLPFVLWELFALAYYGFPFPNTYYAKLKAGIRAMEMLHLGGGYLLETIKVDPITLLIILVGIAIVAWKPMRGLWPIGVGTVFYMIYIVKVGGDFMSGRFFALPFLASVCVLSQLPLQRRQWYAAASIVLVVGLISPYPPLFGRTGGGIKPSRIADERDCYYPTTGLMMAFSGDVPRHQAVAIGRAYATGDQSVVSDVRIGFAGYYAGPKVHMIDKCALADPLLARLPVDRSEAWRIGHLVRSIPMGYEVSLARDTNMIADPLLARYYDKIRIITRAPLFSEERFKTILAMNLGKYNSLLNDYWGIE